MDTTIARTELIYIFAAFFKIYGALAHLARALRWQRRGDRFESDMLHFFILKTITR